MLLGEVLVQCRDILYGENDRYPILPTDQTDDGLRCYVVIADTDLELWFNCWISRNIAVDKIQGIIGAVLKSHDLNSLSSLCFDCTSSDKWQAKTLTEFYLFNNRPWSEIPHVRDSLSTF